MNKHLSETRVQKVESARLGKMIIEGFVKAKEFRNFKFAFIACGQFGGRLGDELARLEHDVIAINTAKSDLNDLKYIPKSDTHLLEGLGGSAKNLKIGQQTILANNALISNVLKDQRILDADFVYVLAGLGGGTGNSALPLILGGLSTLRANKKISGKPTHGAIISMTGDWEPRGMKENAFYGIDAINKLHKSNHCGSVMILDNTKLKNTSTSIFVEGNNADWRDMGNCATASMITEVTSLLDLPSSKSFDKAEFLDVLSTPGYLTFGKKALTSSIESQDKTDLIKEAIYNSPTADGYNYQLNAVNGFLSVVRGVENQSKLFISDSQFVDLEAEFFNFIKSARTPHSGYADIPVWNIVKSRGVDIKKQTIIYVGIVTSDLPSTVRSMFKEVQEFEARLQEEKASQQVDELDLSMFSGLAAATNEEATSQDNTNPFDFFSMTDNDSNKNKKKNDDELLLDPDFYNN